MQTYNYDKVEITDGFLAKIQELNQSTTIHAVYDRFTDTGRIKAFQCSWQEGEPQKPHIFWDSDVAKWMEGAAYILKKHPNPELESKIESLIDDIEKNQQPDGYFNIYFTVCEPEKRFTGRTLHELYCAGHLLEAAVAYAEATGKVRFLHCMERYVDYIYEVFVEKKSAAFHTPGHEEIEIALIRMYRYTKNKKHLDLAAHFINERGTHDDERTEYNQSHKPVREQTEAVGHAVRAVYLYTAMAALAKELNDKALLRACEILYHDVVDKKMYITGGLGSCHIGEAFSAPYDLSNEEAYTETCAGIGLMFFCLQMLNAENKATYADTIERALYNGVLSSLSLDGKSFFYENPLEITLSNHFSNEYGSRRFPITQRVECFECSCCPPNLNRLLPKLGEYIYGTDGDTLFINQFASSTLHDGSVTCKMTTNYPLDGKISVIASGKKKIAVRIPSWCDHFTLNCPYRMEDGYAVFENCGEALIEFDMTPSAFRANSKTIKDAGRLCVQAGPIVYCAESIDNGENLHALAITPEFRSEVRYNAAFGLNCLAIEGYRLKDTSDALYVKAKNERKQYEPVIIHLIPYRCFANRGECDMLTWICEKSE